MKRRTPCLASLALVVLFSLCVIAILAVAIGLVIPRRAAQTFGLPSSRLKTTQQLYLSALLILQEQSLIHPVDPVGLPRAFRIGLGEPTVSVIQRLYDEGFIASADAFRNYLVYSGLDTSLQAGDYQLSQSMNAIEIAKKLQDATPEHVTFRVLPGWRLEEIAAALPTSGLDISPEEFLASVYIRRNGYVFSNSLPPQATLEGFFFPDTYEMTRTLTLEGVISVILENFQANLTPDLAGRFKDQGLDIYSAVTLASIVEREAMDDSEMPMIASVFFNRLAKGMKLDSDPTVQYALGYNQMQNTWWTNPLSLADLNVDSPYNTYKYPGLPPGPIANPGANALKAVAFPESSPYLYFRAACDGSGRHIFARTFEEHVANECP